MNLFKIFKKNKFKNVFMEISPSAIFKLKRLQAAKNSQLIIKEKAVVNAKLILGNI